MIVSASTQAYGDFFALLGFLERAAPRHSPPIGVLATTAAGIRLRHSASMAFPTADVCALTDFNAAQDTSNGPYATVTSAFLGLTGSTTPLPEHLIEGWSQQSDGASALGLHALFDIWHHRWLGLLYRNVIKYSPAQSCAQDGSGFWPGRPTPLLCLWTCA